MSQELHKADGIKDIFEKQDSFNKNFISSSAELEAKQTYTKDVILHLTHELHEVLDEINWKMHKSHNKDINLYRIKEEIIDSFKYLLNIALVWGFTAEEFVDMFYSKSFVVEKRFEMEKSLNSLKAFDKVCAFDIDGVLTDYPRCWVEYCSKRLKVNYLSDSSSPYKAKERLQRYESPVVLSNLRHEYRSSGMKATLHFTEHNIASIFNSLREASYKIVLISARPFEKYPRIFLDTLLWLENNKLSADAILFDRNKHITITKYFPKLKFIVEDELQNAELIARSGFKTYLYDRFGDYDGFEFNDNGNITVIKKLEEILKNEGVVA